MYNKAMKEISQKTPTIKLKPIIQDKKTQKLFTEIGGWW